MAELNWRNLVKDEKEKLIFEALEDDRWDWRTARALARVSELKEDEVRRILAMYPTLVLKCSIPSQTGEDLYTLREKYYKKKSLMEKGWDYLSTKGPCR